MQLTILGTTDFMGTQSNFVLNEKEQCVHKLHLKGFELLQATLLLKEFFSNNCF